MLFVEICLTRVQMICTEVSSPLAFQHFLLRKQSLPSDVSFKLEIVEEVQVKLEIVEEEYIVLSYMSITVFKIQQVMLLILC